MSVWHRTLALLVASDILLLAHTNITRSGGAVAQREHYVVVLRTLVSFGKVDVYITCNNMLQYTIASMTDLRSPICTILGNVNSGKSQLLDTLRNTHIIDNEAGGITQKIGLTQMTQQKIIELTNSINKDINIPGIMFIDTPGHECFSQQRLCGVQISDLVIVLADVFKGIEKQTVECIKLLRKTRTPFIIAINKIDRIHGWKSNNKLDSLKNLFTQQDKLVLKDLESYTNKIIVQMAENGLNAALYYKNQNMKEFISMVPISGKFGDGIPDLLVLINLLSNKFLLKQLTIKQDHNAGYIVEKLKDNNNNNVVSVILCDGTIETDNILLTVSKFNDIYEGTIKTISVPQENKEVKDKFTLKTVNSITAPHSVVLKLDNFDLASGVKFYVTQKNDTKQQQLIREQLTQELKEQSQENTKTFDPIGIYINAQTSGMSEALYSMCQSEKITVAGINIGPLTKTHIMKAETVLNNLPAEDEDDKTYNKRFSIILAFGVDLPPNPEKISKKVTIIHDDVIYKLLDKYKAYINTLDDAIRKRHPNVVPRCELQILDQHIFMRRNPLVFGVIVTKNTVQKGMIIETNNNKILGKITSIQKNKKPLDSAGEQEEVCIKIEPENNPKYEYGKDFDASNILKTHYRPEDVKAYNKFKTIFNA
jgi:translation initiation factor 5B